jgi:hypothetical protein
MAEKRKFKIHPELFHNLILRQAGSLSKAILELVMNSVDAGATKCVISIDSSFVHVDDDGEGFQSREEIERCFETLGQPHTEAEKKKKTYGQFRIGRGQAFAYGVNTWVSNRFMMSVDAKGRGDDYELTEGKTVVTKGCSVQIKLYEQLLPSDLEETKRTLAKWVQYAPIEITLNKKVVSIDPATAKWDHETEDAYIKLKARGGGSLDIYNLGVFVFAVQDFVHGCGGTVVSKKQLRVNFARNDVQSDCPVWRRIKPLINKKTRTNLLNRKVLDDAGRSSLINRIVNKELELDHTNLNLKVITAVTGRHYSIRDLMPSHKVTALTVTEVGSIKGGRIHNSGRAFVLAEHVLDAFDVKDLKQLQRLLKSRLIASYRGYDGYDFCTVPIVNFDMLAEELDSKMEQLSDKDLSPAETLWINLIRDCASAFPETRRYVVGQSESADGWTDAMTYVAINRPFLKRLQFSPAGFGELAALLLHELCHQEDDSRDHEHDQEFYEMFHDRSAKGEPARFVGHCITNLPKIADRLDRRLTRHQLRTADKVEEGARAVTKALAARTT